MAWTRWTALGLLALAGACGGGDKKDDGESLARDLQLAPADSAAPALSDVPAPAAEPAPPPPPAPRRRATPPPAPVREAAPPPPAPPPAPPEPRTRTLAAGTSFGAIVNDTITSRRNKEGETFVTRIDTDVRDASGAIVIPAGSSVTFRIVELKPSENKGDKTGKLTLEATSVSIRGASYPLSASVTNVPYELKGRGVTAGDAAKVGIGAAAGAIAGRILGGNTKGAVIGGVVGAGAGTAVAVQTADRDIVIAPGARIDLTLRSPLEVPR